MKEAADPVAAKIANDAVAMSLRVTLNRVGHVAQVIAGHGLFQTKHQAFVSDVNELACSQWHVPDEVHPAGVTVPTAEDRRHVDIDDVALSQRPIARYPMTDDVVDRDAAALCVTAISQSRRDAARIERHLMDDIIQLLSRNAGHDVRNEGVKNLRREPSGAAHTFESLGPVQLDYAIARFDAVIGGDSDVLSHHA